MANGDFLAKIRLALEGKDQVVSGLNQAQEAVKKLTRTKVTTIFDKSGAVSGKQIEETFKNVGTESVNSARKVGDFEKALRRAAIVAPVWMALRAVMQTVTSTIREGFDTWIAFDQQLIKSKDVIHGFAGDTNDAMKELEGTLRSFSKESGIALKDLASSFYRFGTVGIQFNEALSGAIASAKLAKATLGDTDTISRSLAMGFKLLGDTVDASLTPMQKQESIAGKILALWRTEAFEANEFAGSLANFVSTANVANFTMDETIALLSSLGTAGVQGSRGGTLLKTAIQKLVENLDKLAPTLGIAVNPELEDTFQVLMRVLDAINKLSQTTGIPKEALNTINQIFGGVRGGQAITALNALLPQLKKNLEALGGSPQGFIKGLDDRFKEVNNTVSGQVEIFKRLKEQLGEAFVKGVFGANDFKDSLATVNILMEQMSVIAGNLGNVIRFIGNPVAFIKKDIKDWNDDTSKFAERVEKAGAGLLSLQDTVATINMVADKWGTTAYSTAVMERIKASAVAISKAAQMQEKANKLNEESNKISQESIKNIDAQRTKSQDLSLKLQDRLGTIKEELDVLKLQESGVSKVAVEHAKLDSILNTIVSRYNNLKDASGKSVKSIDQHVVKSKLLKGNFDDVLSIFKEMILSEEEINQLADAYSEINKATISDLDKLVSHEVEIAKLRGLTENQLMDIENSLKFQIYGEDAVKNSLQYQFDLEKRITKEKMNQVDISSDSVNLFKLAQKYGEDAAKEVGKLLSGNMDFRSFQNKASTTSKQAFSEFFSQKEEQFNAAQFFGLISGQGVAEGRRISIPETETAKVRSITELQSRFGQNVAESNRKVSIESLMVNVNTAKDGTKSKEAQVTQLQIDIADAIKNDPKVKQAINERISEF